MTQMTKNLLSFLGATKKARLLTDSLTLRLLPEIRRRHCPRQECIRNQLRRNQRRCLCHTGYTAVAIH